MCGTARTSLYKQHVQVAVRNAHKVSHMPLNTEQFPNDFYASGDMFSCKVCQHNVNG